MTIGSRIKKLRRERDMTQEDLAEALSISAASVSQWECDKTAPDISQLPVLANIFEVTTDFLLGVDVANKEKEIDAIVKEAYSYTSNAHEEKAIPILEDAIRNYPTSYRIMLQLIRAYSSFVLRDQNGNNDIITKYRNEIIRLSEKILNECTDDIIRNTTKQILCHTYQALNMHDKINELAMSQSPLFACQENFAVLASTGTQKFRNKQLYINRELADLLDNIGSLNVVLDDGTRPYSLEERIAIRKKAISLIELFFEDGNYGYFRFKLQHNYLLLAELYSKLADAESTLHHLEQSAHHAIISDTEYDSDKIYSSLVFRGYPFNRVFRTSPYNASHQLLNKLHNETFDFVRTDPRFTAVIEQLTPHAAER